MSCQGVSAGTHAAAFPRPTTRKFCGQKRAGWRVASTPLEREIRPDVFEGFVSFRDHKVRYQRAGENARGSIVLLVHGFGGNADHFRNNIDELARLGNRVYSIDLLGYGLSSKPDPRGSKVNGIYNFDTWSDQILDFIDTVSEGDEQVLISCNSVGGIAGLEAAIKVRLLLRVLTRRISDYPCVPSTAAT